MPRQNYTDITILLDRSGSMATISEATIKGVNGFIASQKEIPGEGCWSLIQFDDQYEEHWIEVEQAEVRELTRETFIPRGSTALLDAICTAIDDKGRRLAERPESERPSKVLFVIMTDGRENSSTEFGMSDANQRITRQREEYSWEFIFMGADQDTIATAAAMGVKTGMTFRYCASAIGTQQAWDDGDVKSRSWKADGNQSAQDLHIDVDVAVSKRGN